MGRRVELFYLREQNDADVLNDVPACQSYSSPMQLTLRPKNDNEF